MANELVTTATDARHMAMHRMRAHDPVTYAAPKPKRIDARFTLMGLANEVANTAEVDATYRKVRVKNTTGGAWDAGTLLFNDDSKLTAQTTAVAVNNPVAGAGVVIQVAATFEIGQIVSVVSGGFTDYAIVTAVSGGASVTVDWLFYDHTTPTVTALPAYEATAADADAAKPAEWVVPSAIADGAYGWAYSGYTVTGIDTTSVSAAEKLVYLSGTAGGYTETAPTGADQIQQVVGIVKTRHATTGAIIFFPGAKRFLKYGTSFLQASAVTSTIIVDAAVTNAKLANMAQSTIKGRAAGAGTGAPTDLTATEATAILNNVVGDSGAGGTKGLVPAPAAGDAAASKFLKADGTWAVVVAYTDEQAQDAVGGILANSTSISLTYSDGTPSITAERAALTGDCTASANSNTTTVVSASTTWATSGVHTSASLGTNQNDYDVGACSQIRLTSSTSIILSSITGGTAGRILYLHNVGGNPITLLDDDGATGTAGNRFAISASVVLYPDYTVTLQYDATSQRWRVFGAAGPNAPNDLSYVTLATSSSLANERVLTAGSGIAITDGGAGGAVTVAIDPATQAEMEAGSITTKAVTPGRQHFHPSAAKGWINFNAADTTPDMVINYNAAGSITDGGVGTFTVNWDTDFSTANLCAVAGGIAAHNQIVGYAAGTTQVYCTNASDAATDPDWVFVVAYGDQ